MNVTNQNPENDSLTITENKDGSFTMDWDLEDPNWKWLNGLTSKEISIIVRQAIEEELKRHGN